MPYETHPLMEEPELTQKLWRYMNFTKFVSLLQKKALYFPSLHQLAHDDPWEGLPSPLNWSPDCPLQITKTEGNISHTHLGKLSDIAGLAQMKKEGAIQTRRTLYTNCWHMNDNESDAQWKIYGAGDFSLALVTDFKKIKDAITDSRKIYWNND